MLDPDNLIGCRTLGRKALLEPMKRRHNPRVLIAQPLDELDGEGRRQRGPLEPPQHRWGGLD
jgi:hypothetical protein